MIEFKPHVCPLCLGEGFDARGARLVRVRQCHACKGAGIVWPPLPAEAPAVVTMSGFAEQPCKADLEPVARFADPAKCLHVWDAERGRPPHYLDRTCKLCGLQDGRMKWDHDWPADQTKPEPDPKDKHAEANAAHYGKLPPVTPPDVARKQAEASMAAATAPPDVKVRIDAAGPHSWDQPDGRFPSYDARTCRACGLQQKRDTCVDPWPTSAPCTPKARAAKPCLHDWTTPAVWRPEITSWERICAKCGERQMLPIGQGDWRSYKLTVAELVSGKDAAATADAKTAE